MLKSIIKSILNLIKRFNHWHMHKTPYWLGELISLIKCLIVFFVVACVVVTCQMFVQGQLF